MIREWLQVALLAVVNAVLRRIGVQIETDDR